MMILLFLTCLFTFCESMFSSLLMLDFEEISFFLNGSVTFILKGYLSTLFSGEKSASASIDGISLLADPFLLCDTSRSGKDSCLTSRFCLRFCSKISPNLVFVWPNFFFMPNFSLSKIGTIAKSPTFRFLRYASLCCIFFRFIK